MGNEMHEPPSASFLLTMPWIIPTDQGEKDVGAGRKVIGEIDNLYREWGSGKWTWSSFRLSARHVLVRGKGRDPKEGHGLWMI